MILLSSKGERNILILVPQDVVPFSIRFRRKFWPAKMPVLMRLRWQWQVDKVKLRVPPLLWMSRPKTELTSPPGILRCKLLGLEYEYLQTWFLRYLSWLSDIISWSWYLLLQNYTAISLSCWFLSVQTQSHFIMFNDGFKGWFYVLIIFGIS